MNSAMHSESIKDMMRQSIVEKSIRILRQHGKDDVEIRNMILKDFRIDAEVLDRLLNAEKID